MYLILFVDRVNMSTAAPLIKADLHLSAIPNSGWRFRRLRFRTPLFQLIGGWIGDKFGPRLTLSVGCAIVGVSTMLTGAVGGFASLFAAAAGAGIRRRRGFPTATRAMASWTPVEELGLRAGDHAFVRAHRQCA